LEQPLSYSSTQSILSDVLAEHVDEIANVYGTRSVIARAPHVKLSDLGKFDSRIAAHLAGLELAGELAWPLCEFALAAPSAGSLFAATLCAILDKRPDRLDRLSSVAAADDDIAPGLVSALGWVERERLQGIAVRLLRSNSWFNQSLGISSCAAHGVDPGLSRGPWLHSANSKVRARSLQCVGELGIVGLVSTCTDYVEDTDLECKFWAAWSAVLLGNRTKALDMLTAVALEPGAHRERALRLTLLAAGRDEAHELLMDLASRSIEQRWLIKGAGWVGDPSYVPWLVDLMGQAKFARIAGEAFSLITGADIVGDKLEGPSVADAQAGPNDDPSSPDTEMDPDWGLPWPAVERVRTWWAAHAQRCVAGERYITGAPVTRNHCSRVLASGYQRQRVVAAEWSSVMSPGVPLFDCCAPAWRQSRALAQLA
jgi:uncharacterized protein (TIGR02270 family)